MQPTKFCGIVYAREGLRQSVWFSDRGYVVFYLAKVSVVKAVGLLVQMKYIVNKICVLFGNGQGRDCSLNCPNLLSECAVVIF
jgi:hypothetical protein